MACVCSSVEQEKEKEEGEQVQFVQLIVCTAQSQA